MPHAPAANAQMKDVVDGNGSPTTAATTTLPSRPIDSPAISAEKTLEKRLTRPPPKSPAPHQIAESRP